MRPDTIFKLYSLAMGADSRLKKDPMTPDRAQLWSEVYLQDVPDQHYELIAQHIYRVPQMLTLQAGHITQAWDELEETVGSQLRRAQALAKKIKALTPRTRYEVEDWNDLAILYTAACEKLPAYVRHAAGLSPVDLKPVPPLERAEPPANLKFLTDGGKQ
ncbi:hypothetical protein [Rothia aeria]|uniref:hypothetical protein n=1 Tax=Rothia aeria TaxID=172042 RepID=UPI003C7D96F1